MPDSQKKFYTSVFFNNLILLDAVMFILIAFVFAKLSLAISAMWIALALVLLWRYVGQTRNPYLEITKDEVRLNKSPLIKSRVRIKDIEKIIKSTKYTIVLKIRNARKTKISLLSVEKSKRENLVSSIKEIVSNNQNM